MKVESFNDVQVGDALPGLIVGPMARHAVGVYAGASRGYNPLHFDSDCARELL